MTRLLAELHKRLFEEEHVKSTVGKDGVWIVSEQEGGGQLLGCQRGTDESFCLRLSADLAASFAPLFLFLSRLLSYYQPTYSTAHILWNARFAKLSF